MDNQLMDSINKAKQMMNNFNNPKIMQVMQMLQNRNQTPEQMVRDICKQQGIDVEDLLNELRN